MHFVCLISRKNALKCKIPTFFRKKMFFLSKTKEKAYKSCFFFQLNCFVGQIYVISWRKCFFFREMANVAKIKASKTQIWPLKALFVLFSFQNWITGRWPYPRALFSPQTLQTKRFNCWVFNHRIYSPFDNDLGNKRFSEKTTIPPPLTTVPQTRRSWPIVPLRFLNLKWPTFWHCV